MNVIFLDIDGVIQPLGSQERHSHDLVALRERLATERSSEFLTLDQYDIGAVYYDWPAKNVSAIKRLCREGNAQIVISSAWRRSKTLQQLQRLFSLHELETWVIDLTPDLEGNGRTRADEIQAWLEIHPEVTNYVILDDDYERAYARQFPGKYVICRSYLTEAEITAALEILGARNPAETHGQVGSRP